MIIETKRLILRKFTLFDLNALSSIMADPEVMQFSVSGPWDRERTKKFLEECQIDYSPKRWGYGRWAVIHKTDKQLIGFCGIARFDDVDGSPEIEIGYRLSPKYWGCGFATEAAAATRDYAFKQLGLKRLISMIEPENVRSIRVVEKIGMTCEKKIEKWSIPILVYSILKTSQLKESMMVGL